MNTFSNLRRQRQATQLLCAATLCLASATPIAQAALVTFDPGSSVLVEIDNNTGATRYTNGDYRFSADGLAFFGLDGVGTGGSDALALLAGSSTTLTALGGGAFSLLGLDFGLSPLDASGTVDAVLTVSGFIAGSPVLTQDLMLSSLASFSFSPNWSNLSQVTFFSTGDAVIDSISAVPEPASWALTGLGLLALLASRAAAARRSVPLSGT